MTLVGGSISLVHTSPQIGGAFIALLPTLALIANGLSWGLRSLRQASLTTAGEANALLTETIANIRVVHSYTAEAQVKEKYSAALDEASRAKIRLATATGALFALVKLGGSAIVAAICLYGGYLVNEGVLSSGDIAKLLAQSMKVQSAASKFSKATVSTVQVIVAMRRHCFDSDFGHWYRHTVTVVFCMCLIGVECDSQHRHPSICRYCTGQRQSARNGDGLPCVR